MNSFNIFLIKFAQQVKIDPDDERLENLPRTQLNHENTIPQILQIVFGFGGAIALIVLVLAGLRYATSLGDPARSAAAKNTIIYTAIGLVVMVTAFGIVSLILRNT
jgi:hypothetical protein